MSNIEEALGDVGLAWEVRSRPIFVDSGNINAPYIHTDKFVANVRADNNQILGVVSDKYEVIQNKQAFSFLDYMIPEGLEIVCGGVIHGKKVYLVCKLQSFGEGSDTVDLFVIFTNTHDGKGSVRACITPLRISCQNAINLAFNNSYRSWSISHVGDIQGKLHTAEQTMLMISDYVKVFQKKSQELMDRNLTNSEVGEILAKLFPLADNASAQKENVVNERRETVKNILHNAPDLQRGTAWDFINAVSDYTTHYVPSYDVPLFRTSNLNKVIKGHPLIDAAYKLVA